MTSTLPLLYTSYYLILLVSIIFINFQSPIRFHGSSEFLYFCSPTLLVMMMKRRVRMEEWFPWGRASTCTRTWRRTCMPTRSRGCCGCGGFIRSVREGSSVTTWGVSEMMIYCWLQYKINIVAIWVDMITDLWFL